LIHNTFAKRQPSTVKKSKGYVDPRQLLIKQEDGNLRVGQHNLHILCQYYEDGYIGFTDHDPADRKIGSGKQTGTVNWNMLTSYRIRHCAGAYQRLNEALGS